VADSADSSGRDRVRPVVVVHAGAGSLSAELHQRQHECRVWLRDALSNAQVMLEAGHGAIEAAKSAVQILESCELFNAGYGSALCSDGTVQMSAALMDGAGRRAGAAAGIRTVKHPIVAAYVVLESDQVLMIGEDADRLAIAAGAERWRNQQFVTARQKARLAAYLDQREHGTVGAVCLDARGELAAATSTGGITGQPPGRVGDSPLIGAGTWADRRVAISCTGDGEAFIRSGTARHIATLVESGVDLPQAANRALGEVSDLGASGGLIALDADGSAVMPFSAQAMPRGLWRAGEPARVWITEPETARAA
jgi:beta-aspartyl-peptidase (threonine type)